MTQKRDARRLYQDVLLRHAKASLPPWPPESKADGRTLRGSNPMCGDEIELWIAAEDAAKPRVLGYVKGCAVCRASLSMLLAASANSNLTELLELTALVREQLSPSKNSELNLPDTLASSDLAALTAVRDFPMRLRCASLAWDTLLQAQEPADE